MNRKIYLPKFIYDYLYIVGFIFATICIFIEGEMLLMLFKFTLIVSMYAYSFYVWISRRIGRKNYE
jgi:hypothetical protein